MYVIQLLPYTIIFRSQEWTRRWGRRQRLTIGTIGGVKVNQRVWRLREITEQPGRALPDLREFQRYLLGRQRLSSLSRVRWNGLERHWLRRETSDDSRRIDVGLSRRPRVILRECGTAFLVHSCYTRATATVSDRSRLAPTGAVR